MCTLLPVCRAEDRALMTVTELALILLYTCALVIKTCELSEVVCRAYGFGDSKGDGPSQHACVQKK